MGNVLESFTSGIKAEANHIASSISDEAHKAMSVIAAQTESAKKSNHLQQAGLLPHFSLTGASGSHSTSQAQDSGSQHASETKVNARGGHRNFLMHNALDVLATMANGGVQKVVKSVEGDIHAAASVVRGTEHAIVNKVEQGASWATHNPIKASCIAGLVVAGVVAEVATGGLATGLIVDAVAEGSVLSEAATSAAETMGAAIRSSSVLNKVGAVLASPITKNAVLGLGIAGAGIGSTRSAFEVNQHGELKVLMNQQNETPEAVSTARLQLKKDTAEAILADMGLAAGIVIGPISKIFSTARAVRSTSLPTPSEVGQEVVEASVGLEAAAGEASKDLPNLLNSIKGLFDHPIYATVNGAGTVAFTGQQVSRGYAVTAPEMRTNDNNNDTRSETPDEPARVR